MAAFIWSLKEETHILGGSGTRNIELTIRRRRGYALYHITALLFVFQLESIVRVDTMNV